MLSVPDYSYLFDNSTAKKTANYTSYQANATTNLGTLNEIKQTAAAVTEIRQNASAVVDSYNEAKDTFYQEFDSNMAALKKSAANVKNFNFNVGENPISKTAATDDEGNVLKDKNGATIMKTTYSKTMQSALDAVKDFISDYNDSINFLKANSAVSGRVERMAANFGDTTYRLSLYEQVGISVGKDGTLSIDEEKLADAIANNPDKVSRILGKNGLAGKAEQHVDTANGQRNNLFPSAKAMLGNQLDAASLYTGGAFANMTSIANIGNLINMMF